MRDDFSPTLATMLSGEEITRCFLIKLDNGILADVLLTDHDADKVVGGDTFLHSPGFTVTKFTVADGGRPAGLDFTLPFDGDGPLYSNDIKRGVWRGASISVWLANSANPSDRYLLIAGDVGKTHYTDRLAGKIEIATKADTYADIILPTAQLKCWYQYGAGVGLCPVDLATKTLTATIATLTSNSKFTITVTNPDAFDFTHGKVTITSGNNDGALGQVRRWTSGTHLVEMVIEFPLDIQVGDTLTISRGCKQDRADCKANGAINSFPGFDFTPGELLGGA